MQNAARSRKDLSLSDKIKVLEASTNGMSQIAIAQKFGVSASQVSRIISNRETVLSAWASNGNLSRKRMRGVNEKDVDEALLLWFQQKRANNAPISGLVLKEKAKILAAQLHVPDFTASEGWLWRWKTRNNILFKQAHGEKQDGDVESAVTWIRDILPKLIEGYSTEVS